MLSSGPSDTRGAVGVEGWPSRGADIRRLTHGVLVSRGVTQNTTNTNYLAVSTPVVGEFPECRKDKGM